MNFSNDEESLLEYLFLHGAVTISHVDLDTGDIFYKITPKMFELFPELYQEYLNAVNQDVMRLWEKGFIKIDLLDDNPMVGLEPKAFIEEELSMLSSEDRSALQEIKRILAN